MNDAKKAYQAPELIEYGPIGDHTFTTPHGQVKGCTTNCHTDNFNELSALAASP